MNKSIYWLIMILISLSTVSCNNPLKKENEALKQEVAMLAERNAELAEGNYEMEHSIDQYNKLLEEIDQQLAQIDDKKVLIRSKSTEFETNPEVQQEIEIHLDHLHHQVENTKHKIAYMNQNMHRLRKENANQHEELHKMDIYINDLANLIVERDSEIMALHDVMLAQGMTIDVLISEFTDQAMYSEVLLDIINTGFFVAGTKKELKEMEIIDMEGGFIGIGRVKTLKANAPVEFFTPIDIRQTNKIELTGKKGELLTPHPEDSYEFSFDKETNQLLLEISNKLTFWQETNYLVVVVNDQRVK